MSGWRRRTIGAGVSLATLLVLGLMLELGVRLLVPDAFFSQYQPIWRPDPQVGFTLRPGFDGIAFGAPVRANALGYRGPDWPQAKPPGTLRIALLGDSHAFGYGIPCADSLGPQLERALAARGVRAEVLCFALPGYNAWQQHETLLHKAFAFAPDLVIAHLTQNDHEPAIWCSELGWLHRRSASVPSTRALVAAGPPPGAERGPGLRAHSKLYLWARIQWQRRQRRADDDPARWPTGDWMVAPPPGPISAAMRGAVLEPLRGMAQACHARGVPFVLAAMVVGPDYRHAIDALAAELDVPVLLLFGLFPEIKSWEQMVEAHGLGWDDHLDGRAHARCAQGIVELCAERGLLAR
jgi:hypothetical protein